MSGKILTVAIATTAKRIAALNLSALPAHDDLTYHIFVQGADSIADLPEMPRPDICATLSEGIGAARNRNAALENISTPLMVFADDDLCFCLPGLIGIISRFAAEPEIDFLCARLSDETGRLRKRYSPDGAKVHWWNCGKVGTPELALRPNAFQAKALAFDPRFGAGMPDYLGDEYIFLCDALRAGLRGRHVALVLASHPKESSGTRADPATMDIRKRVLIRALGRWKSKPARLIFALRHWQRFESLKAIWRFV
jgi:hypothetical protein